MSFDTKAFERALASMKGGEVSMEIGYNANYAAAVHEVLTNQHEPPGQAKFLETAMREAAESGMVERSVAAKAAAAKTPADLPDAVLAGVREAGIQTIGNAQAITPVDTGFLAGSATWNEPEVK